MVFKPSFNQITIKKRFLLFFITNLLILSISSTLFATSVFAQIKGRVTDKQDNPIAKASVQIVNSTNTVITDSEGRFSIDAKANDVLQVTSIGYKSKEIPVNNQLELFIQLE